MSKRLYPFPYKTLGNQDELVASSISIDNITIDGPASYPTYTLTLPTSDGNSGQILSTNGSGVLSWVNQSTATGTVTSVSASVPTFLSVTVSNPTTTPNIAITGSSTGTNNVVLSTAPTIDGTMIFTGAISGTRSAANGEAIFIYNSSTSATENWIAIGRNSSTSNHAHFGHHFVSGGSASNYAYISINSLQLRWNGTTLSNLTNIVLGNTTISDSALGALSLILPANAGSSGQVLTSAGSGNSMTWTTPTTGTVTSVSGSSPIVSSGGNTPAISLSTVPTTLGGTGLTTVGTNGQVLTSNGTTLSWATPTMGTVTSVSGSSPIVSSGGNTPAISLSTVPTTLGGTGLTTIGTANQVLSSTGSVLQWITLPTPVTSVSGTSPINSSGGSTPSISLSTVPTTLGGTGLTTVGTNGQVLTSNGTTLSWQTPSAPGVGTVTSVSASVPSLLSVSVSNPTSTPAITISYSGTALPIANGGTGLTTIGTNGQVLTSNGTSYTWSNPVTSVGATSPLASSGGTSPNISISSSTGTGAVVLQNTPTLTGTPIISQVAGTAVTASVTLNAGTTGSASTGNQTFINMNTVGGGGGVINQYISTGYSAANSYFINLQAQNDIVLNTPSRIYVPGSPYIQIVDEQNAVSTNTLYTLIRSFGGIGIFGYKNNTNTALDLQFAYQSGTYGTPQIGMTLSSLQGNVGIGTLSPLYKLMVVGNDAAPADLTGAFCVAATSNNNQRVHIGYATSGDYGWIEAVKVGTNIQPLNLQPRGGNAGVNLTSAPTQPFDVNGNIRTRGSFTSNNTDFFTYAEGTFTPLMAIYFGTDFKVYPTAATPPSGRGALTVSQTIQNGKWIRVGSQVTVQVDVAYSYVIPALQTMSDCYICIQIPDAIKPNNIGAVGVSAYPMFLQTSLDTIYMAGYYVSSATLSTGGTTGFIVFSRTTNNTFLQWDNNNKSGQRVSVTVTYQCSQ
jgi:hypothetical protein